MHPLIKTFLGFCLFVAVCAALDAIPDSRDPAQQACDADWHNCADNDGLARSNNAAYRHATIACKDAAEARAQFGKPQWPWLAFHHVLPGDEYVKTGQAVLIEPDAQFMNAFGATVNSRVVCTYDMNLDHDELVPADLAPNWQKNVVAVEVVTR